MDRDIIGEYVAAWLDENIERVLEEFLEKKVRERNLEAFKREMVPPQHWRG